MSAHRRYALITFLTWLPTGLFLPVMILLMLDRGLSLPAIATIGLFYSVTITVLELPTGGLADVIGRRPVLIASSVAGLLGLVVLGLSTAVWGFALASVLRAVARALSSGPAEAWYVDTVHAVEGTETDLGPGLARGNAAGSWALTIGTLAGGFIPLVLVGVVPVPLAIPVLLAAVVEAVRLVVLIFGLPERRYARPGVGGLLRGVPATVGEGLRLFRSEGTIARLVLLSGAIGVALATIELLTPAWMAALTGAFETAGVAYAVVAALGFSASAIGAGLSMRLVRLFRGRDGRVMAGRTGIAVMALALLGLGATTVLSGLAGVIVAGGVYFLIFVGLGASNPALSTILHERTNTAQRATVISMQSLSLQVFGAAGALGSAWLAAKTDAALAFGVSAVVMAAAILLIPRPTAQIARTPDLAPTMTGR